MLDIIKKLINPHMYKMGPCAPKHFVFGDHFYSKMSESSGSMYSSILMLENIYCFTWSEPNSQEILNLFSREFGLLQVKWLCPMFSNMKKKEYMESELSDIFRVKVVAKNILLGSLVTQRQSVFAMRCLFLKKHTNF